MNIALKKFLIGLSIFSIALLIAYEQTHAQTLPTPIQAPTSMPGLPGMPPIPMSNMGGSTGATSPSAKNHSKNISLNAQAQKSVKVVNPNLNVDISRVLPQLVTTSQALYKNMSGFENFNEDMLMFHIKKVDAAFWDKYKAIDFVAYTQSEDTAVVGMKTPKCDTESPKVKSSLDKSAIRYEAVTCAGSYVRVVFKQN